MTADFDTIRENLRSIVDLTAQADYVDVWESAALAALARVEAAAEQAEKALAGIETTCREWLDNGSRCGQPAEFLLWGKMTPFEALGPRCYNHAAAWVGHRALGNPAWAILDLRPGSAALSLLRMDRLYPDTEETE